MNKKNKVIIFGASENSINLYNNINLIYEIIAFCDNDKSKQNKKILDKNIYSPEFAINNLDFDYIIVASMSGLSSIVSQLINMNVKSEKIITKYVEENINARVSFLKNFSILCEEFYKIHLFSVAECGVFQGEFAKEINKYFSKSKLYLFDTFSGFDENDIIFEEKYNLSNSVPKHLSITSEEIVLSKMINKDKVIIKKGYFPFTAEGIDECFCFVNIDFDLYKPTLEALKFFYPKMVQGGIVLVHDFFSESYKGIRKAVLEFCQKNKNINIFPIGDGMSIAIQKYEEESIWN